MSIFHKDEKEWSVPVSILVGALLISGSILYRGGSFGSPNSNGGTDDGGAPTALGNAEIKLASDTPFLGNKDADVVVVEYADYQCPFCEKFFTDVMPQIKKNYIDTGKIKFVYQDFAFLGPDSQAAAEASQCAAEQGAFWQYHDYLFKNQGQENSGWASAENQKKIAQNLGLNTTQFNQCLDSHKYEKKVTDQTADAKSYGVSGTPTVFINGKPVVGAQPYSSFAAAIDAALK